MKALVVGLLLCLALFSSSLSFASCGGSSGCASANRYDECGSGASNTCGDTGWNYYSEAYPPSDCQCSDNGWRYNDCISKCEYCEAFGNIGAR